MALSPVILVLAGLKTLWTIKSATIFLPSYNLALKDITDKLEEIHEHLPEDKKYLTSEVNTRVWKNSVNNFKLFFKGFINHEAKTDPICFLGLISAALLAVGLSVHIFMAILDFLIVWVLIPTVITGIFMLIDPVRDMTMTMISKITAKTSSLTTEGQDWVVAVIQREKAAQKVRDA